MLGYHKFSERFRPEVLTAPPPKPAKAPNGDISNPNESPSLGGFGALGGVRPSSTLHRSPPLVSGAPPPTKAATVEFQGNVPREWAEGYARLDPESPPGDVPAARWRRFVDDIGRFLDHDFARVAAGLGWGTLDLFGCDKNRPFARLDQAGLMWLLAGNRLIALAERTAVIQTASGARQTYRRKASEPGRVLAWQLEGVLTQPQSERFNDAS